MSPTEPLRRAPKPWGIVAAGPFLLFLLLPLLSLPAHLRWDQVVAALGRPALLDALTISVTASLCATGLAIVLGTPVAYLLARRRGAVWRLLDGLTDLPMVLPPAVAGMALLMAFGRQSVIGGWLDQWHWRIAFSFTAVVLAELFVAAPFYIRAASVGFAGVDRDLEHAAAVDGATPGQVFAAVTMPLALPNLLSGALTCWARALGEFGATIIFAGNLPGVTQTMPLAIYLGFELDLSVALTLSLVLLVASLAVLLLIKRAWHRTWAEGH